MSTYLPGFFQGTEMPSAGWWETLWPDPAAVLTAVGLKPGLDVVDLCSGDGWFTLHIARLTKRVIAIDLDPSMLEVARTRLTAGGIANCEFRAGDAYELASLAGRPVDFVFMANAFHGVPDQPRLVRAVHDALKPGGQFAIVNWHARPREETTMLGEPRGPRTELRLSPSQTIETVVAEGMSHVMTVNIAPYHYGVTFQRNTE
jgi:ubiquinone/menaquinone biosynthesis C-methylase UbiE